MAKTTHLSIPFLILLATIFGCSKEDREIAYANQESRIETFVENQKSSDENIRVEYNNGVTRVVVSEGDGPDLTARGTVEFYYAGFNFSSGTINSSTLFATNSSDLADAYNWNITDTTMFRPVRVNLSEDPLLEGLKRGLPGVREGEECYILFSGKYAYGKHSAGTIPANAALAFHILVTGVEN